VAPRQKRATRAGWEGWDAYAPFYDWENVRTVGRRDVAFWRKLAQQTRGRVLELGCGTGRLLQPLARADVNGVGVDRSAPMLAHARTRLRRSRLTAGLVRGDITTLPFGNRAFDLIIAPYGMLQSLLSDALVSRTLDEAARVLAPGGRFGIDLVPDVPRWREYKQRETLRGRGPRGRNVRLIETVRQDRPRKRTIFEHEYVEGTGPTREVTRFTIAFRTLDVPTVVGRLERAGFHVDALLGDYKGEAWDPRADVWIILATRV
jgi:SAM-dependent methyltransferase